MPDLCGINHLTVSTSDLDRLVTYYEELLGARLAFERAATSTDPRVAVVDVGGDDHLMIVETATAPRTELDPLGRAGWGLRVGTYAQLREVRERVLRAGWPVGEIETLPTQWTVTVRDPDGRPVDVRAHRPRTAPSPTGGRGVGAEDADALPGDLAEVGGGAGAGRHGLIHDVVVDDVALAAFVAFPADEALALRERDRLGDGRRADAEACGEF